MPASREEITSLEDARWLRLRVVPGAEAGTEGSLRLYDGVRATARTLDDRVELDLALEAPDADADPRVAVQPEHVVFEVERRGTALGLT